MASSASALAPRAPGLLAGWRDLHAGATVVVCGCGRSLAELPTPGRWLTIGVNDVGRLFDPTYLVVVNPRSQFRGDRFRYVVASRARALFTQLDPRRDLGLTQPAIVRFRLGRRGGTDLDDPDALPYTRNSPYVAVCLAAFLGARRIGLIGVDFTDHHFFAPTGTHPLARELAQIDREYGRLATALARRGVELVNLSAESRLAALPRAAPADFLGGGPAVPGAPAASRPPRVRPSPGEPQERSVMKRPLRVLVQGSRGSGLVALCLNAFADTAARCGHAVSRGSRVLRGRPGEVSVVWNGRQHHAAGPTLYCEHGWLPRSAYQVSPRGINAGSHLAPFRWDGRPLADDARRELAERLDALRREALAAGGGGGVATGLPAEFLLVPLQIEGDLNLERYAPPRLRRMQALIDALAAAAPPLPLVFKQHPADLRRGRRQLRLGVRRRQDLLLPQGAGSVHDLLRLPGCRGIVSINSNVVHDGLLWEVPAVVLGDNVWPRREPSPFLLGLPRDWRTLAAARDDPRRRACREAYAAYLLAHQWTVDDLRDEAKVDRLLRGVAAGAAVPRTEAFPRPVAAPFVAPAAGARAAIAPGRRRPAPRPRSPRRRAEPLVNVVARNRGWLFEDLKRHFAAAGGPPRVVASDRPRRDADAWIFLRTVEAVFTPDPRRTLVQIHDLFDGGLYRRGERRRAVERCAALTLTHPAQRQILEGSGIALEGKRLLCRPLGAGSAFTLREAPGDRFTVGWVGRPVRHGGEDLKRVGWLVEALRLLAPPPAVVLLGERLEETARALARAGIECRLLDRRRHPYATYPEHYRRLDCLAVTSRLAAGPNSLFEALASGVPVVSTRVGWAPNLIRDGENGYLVDSAAELAAALERVRADRDGWYARRADVRRSLHEWTLEGWVEENRSLAAALAGAGAP